MYTLYQEYLKVKNCISQQLKLESFIRSRTLIELEIKFQWKNSQIANIWALEYELTKVLSLAKTNKNHVEI